MTTPDRVALTALRRRLDRATAHRDVLSSAVVQRRAHLAERQQRVEADDVALHAVRALREAATERVQQRIADLTTEGLRVVFDDPQVALEVRMVERRGVVEADLVLVRGGIETDPLEGNGGGLVADVAAMLRLVMVRMMTRRGIAPLLVLDEPFAALSAGHRAAMADTLEQVAASLGIQVLTVTHADEFARGNVYRVEWDSRADVRARVVAEDA